MPIKPSLKIRVFQNNGPVMAVFKASDPRPGKADLYSTTMRIEAALRCALHVVQCKSIDHIVVDDPHGLLFPLTA